MPFITANDGTQLYWREWGRGAQMVFVSALGCGSAMCDYAFAEFGERGMRCICLDRRGHGRSDQSAQGYDFDTLADDLATLIDALELKEITLVSHSMGSGEIVRYLSRHGSARSARIVIRRGLPRRDAPHRRAHADRARRSRSLETGGLRAVELIRGARLKVYPGAPHGLLYTHMDQLHADIWDFVRS